MLKTFPTIKQNSSAKDISTTVYCRQSTMSYDKTFNAAQYKETTCDIKHYITIAYKTYSSLEYST